MLRLSPESSVPFLSQCIDTRQTLVREAALLALGESRRPEALDLLKASWSATGNCPLRRMALLAIAMLRQEPAMAYLLPLVTHESFAVANDAIAAVSIHKYDETLSEQVQKTAQKRQDLNLTEVVAKIFGH